MSCHDVMAYGTGYDDYHLYQCAIAVVIVQAFAAQVAAVLIWIPPNSVARQPKCSYWRIALWRKDTKATPTCLGPVL